MLIVCPLGIQSDPRLLLRALESQRDLCMVTLGGLRVLTWGAVDEVVLGPGWQGRARSMLRAQAPPQGLPFAGGLIGHLSYEAGRFSERMPAPMGPSITGDGGLRRYPGGLVCTPEGWVLAGEEAWVKEAESLLKKTPLPTQSSAPCASLALLPPDEDFTAGVGVILARIAAGDCYQVNLARALDFRSTTPPAELFAALPLSAHAAYLSLGDAVLMSESPELFWRLRGGQVTTRPIKGTAGLGQAQALMADPKERAELTMIVDLMRNDLGRVCVPGSVRAHPRRILTLPTLLHAEQPITGSLRPGIDAIDLMDASFPPGSVTGAPKVQAMEVIHALEPTPRGAYTGAIGAFIDGGDAEFSVAIRVAQWRAGALTVHVGCGVVADSQPEREVQETWLKAQAWMRALGVTRPAGR